MNKIALTFVLCFATGFAALQRAAAQAAPPVAFQLPAPGALPSANGANKPSTTIIVHIYGGAGYFDDALAEKLRPMLATAFSSSRPDPVKPVPDAAVAAPAKGESQSKATLAAHL